MRHLSRQQISRLQYRATGAQRLSMLATFLDEMPANRLTLGYWFKKGRGCAVGLAAAGEPWFQAQGLRLQDVDDPVHCHPTYREHSDWGAVAAFFDLSFEDCRRLFSAEAYEALRPSPRSIAGRIRGHLARHAPAETGAATVAAGPGE